MRTWMYRFARAEFARAGIAGLDVLEVGSFDVNGSVGSAAKQHSPRRYVGVDIVPGPGVDVVCSAEDLVNTFGEASFDVVVTTEMLEHVPNWKSAIMQMKQVLRPGGRLILTTRSRGFHLHGYPADYWRFSTEDMGEIFSDFDDLRVVSDQVTSPGVFVSGTKSHREATSLDQLTIYSIVARRRRPAANRAEIAASKFLIAAKARIPRFLIPVGKRAIRLAGSLGAASRR